MKTADIPTIPILVFLAKLDRWGCWFPGMENSVANAMPEGLPDKLILSKMRSLIKKGLVSGCPCGCRGDYELTDNGRDQIKNIMVEESVPQ